MAVNMGEIYTIFGADTSPLVKSQKQVDSISKNMEKFAWMGTFSGFFKGIVC